MKKYDQIKKELKDLGIPIYASKKDKSKKYIRKEDAKTAIAYHTLTYYDKSIMPIRVQNADKAHKMLAALKINTSDGFIRTKDVEKVMLHVKAELVGNQIIWYDKNTNEVIAAFDIWQKLKSASKTLLKKGALVLIGIAILAGSASGKDKQKEENLKSKYAKSIEMIGSDLGLELDVSIDTKKAGDVSKTYLKITNEDSGNMIKFEITKTADGSFSDVQMKKLTKEKGAELDYDFEGLGMEMFESMQDQIVKKGLKK